MNLTTGIPTRAVARSRLRQRSALTGAGLMVLLSSRALLFALWQGVIALVYLALGTSQAWAASVPWWPVTAALTNVVSIVLLAWLVRREGGSIRRLCAADRRHLWRDLLGALALIVVIAPFVVIPNTLLATWLFGDPMAPAEMMFRPLPLWAALVAMVAFPLTIPFAELPTYFGYGMPRLATFSFRAWVAVLLPALFLALQHAALPLIFDARFIAWRALMFLPFALITGAALYRRPQLMPYMMAIHGLLDAQTAWMVLRLALGQPG